jgi:hypothetical protein
VTFDLLAALTSLGIEVSSAPLDLFAAERPRDDVPHG